MLGLKSSHFYDPNLQEKWGILTTLEGELTRGEDFTVQVDRRLFFSFYDTFLCHCYDRKLASCATLGILRRALGLLNHVETTHIIIIAVSNYYNNLYSHIKHCTAHKFIIVFVEPQEIIGCSHDSNVFKM